MKYTKILSNFILRIFPIILVIGIVFPSTNSLAMSVQENQQVRAINTPLLGPVNPTYRMNISYDQQNHTISGKMKVAFTNNLGHNMNLVYFNVWANAKDTRGQGDGVTVQNIKVNGKPATYSLADTVLKITDFQLASKKTGFVEMDFTVSIPPGHDSFGWTQSNVTLGNWFPTLAVYDQKGWNTPSYCSTGENSYTLTSQFDVLLTTDKSQVISTTGSEVGRPQESQDAITRHYIAKNVRDFAIVMDPTFKVKSGFAGNVKVNVYYNREETAEMELKTAIESILLFNQKFGSYPWPKMDIVQTTGASEEFPQLAMIPSAKTNDIPINDQTKDALRAIISHETAHQWFYGIIGNNQSGEPWLDEAFARYAERVYMGDIDSYTSHMEPVNESNYHVSSSLPTLLTPGATDNEGRLIAYQPMAYEYGARTINDLRKVLGDEQFYKSMRDYFNKYKFGIATTAGFMKTMEQTSKKDLSSFFKEHRVFASEQK